jgi:TRAP-type C4-dicarboxylate transport system substrate-binding protein
MKRMFKSTLAATAFAIASPAVLAQEIILKVHHLLSPTSYVQENLIAPWCNKIQKESAGKLKCQIYPAMQLGGTPAQLFDQAKDGVADIVWTVPTYQAGRFAKSEVFELPFVNQSSQKTSPAVWEYIQKNALDEFKGTRPLFIHMNEGMALHMAKPGFRRMEDLKGVKLRAPTRLSNRLVAALGATPVQMPIPQVPESISKGVMDGAFLGWDVATAMKIQEVVKSHIETTPGMTKISAILLAMVMNPAKYDSLPPDLKKVIDQNSGLETSRWAGDIMDKAVPASRKIGQDRKNEFVTLSPQEHARWVKATASVSDDWVKEVSAKGANGKALLEDAKALIAKQR